MSDAPLFLKHLRSDTPSIVMDAQSELGLAIPDGHLDPARLCMPERVAHRLPRNSVDSSSRIGWTSRAVPSTSTNDSTRGELGSSPASSSLRDLMARERSL